MKKQKNTENKVQKNPFSLMEEDVLKFWEDNKIFEKSIEKEAPNGDYVFYDGPPFITGLPHYATLLPSIAKDMIPRYWTMKGYRVKRVWGWDCHGLPAENKVEKELGLKNKKDIEELGVDKFVNACRDYVTTGSEQWEWYINRIGRWVDMKNAYKTMDLKFMESVIWAFKELYGKGLIYEGYRSSLHCPRCATPLSKFEITMDAGSYKDVIDDSVVVKFKIKNPELIIKNEKINGDIYILAWTTTPWTLPGNLALAINKNRSYILARVQLGGVEQLDELETPPKVKGYEYYIVLKEKYDLLLGEHSPEKIKTMKGKDLIELEYEPLFDLENKEISENKNTYKIYHGDFVSTEEGTGVVHIAPNFGEDDFEFGKKYELPMVDLMDEMGSYTELAGKEWNGLYFKKVNTKVLEILGDKLFLKEPHEHSYPFCYRCNSRLIYKTQKAWYLRISEIRNKMLKSNKDINWVPKYFKDGRFKYNLENAPDWCLSRSRYWGSPLPVWRCENCDEIKVVGLVAEIEKLSNEKIKDLHKPAIDKVEFKCEKCQGKMKRVVEVLDCWFESGSMPFAQFHYPFEKKDEWKNIFPADFIIEYTGQLRGWFYYLHVLANALFDSLAFKNVIVSGVLAGTDGRKMSKSYGNYPDPKNTLHKYGADALRLYFMSSSIMMGDDTTLNEKDIQDALRKNVMLLWNVAKFYDMFCHDKEAVKDDLELENILDKWIVFRLNQVIKEVTDNIEKYNLQGASRPVTGFIDDLSTWYLRRSRDRFKGDDENDKIQALKTTRHVLLTFSKVIAPVMPFIAEQVWQKVSGNDFENKDKSVHLEGWTKTGKIDKNIIAEMEATRKIVELGLAKRDEAGIKVRQPLSKLRIMNYKIRDEYIDLIKDELNVKEVDLNINVSEELKIGEEVELDTKLTPELKQEGMKREIVRTVNSMRKNIGLTINDRIVLFWQSENKDIIQAIEKYQKDICVDVLADEIVDEKNDAVNINKDLEINGAEIWLGIK
ncbi:isoleucine--tRNA ligase [Candidatus Parcubacteria bacterium]|nr:isoleucine--tRNA ligase [Candidatus Parcubacteria bacterium]